MAEIVPGSEAKRYYINDNKKIGTISYAVQWRHTKPVDPLSHFTCSKPNTWCMQKRIKSLPPIRLLSKPPLVPNGRTPNL